MIRDYLLPCESLDGAPYPEGRNAFGVADVSVCGPILMTRAELEYLLAAIPERGTYLEIGSWCSAGLGWVADRRPHVHCIGVDCFEGPPNRRLFAAIANWDLRPNVNLYLGRVEDFMWRDNHFDVILVDGDHSGDAVARDLSIAADLVKTCGVILAHDYDASGHPEVKPAIDAFCEEHGWLIAGRADSLVLLQYVPL
jgi:predicted O-methyltransferase YrrM